MVGQVPENLDGFGGFSGARVNHSGLILRHSCKLFVLAGANFFQLLESLIVAFEVFVAKGGVIGCKPAGIRVWVLLSDSRKFLNSVFGASGFGGIERLTRIVGIGHCTDARRVGPCGDVERGGRLNSLAVDIKAPAKIAHSDDHDGQDGGGENGGVRKNGLSAVLDSIVDLVLLQFLTRNMFRHKRSPAWIGIIYRSTRGGQAASTRCDLCSDGAANYPCNMRGKRPQLRHAAGVKLEACKPSVFIAGPSTSLRMPTPRSIRKCNSSARNAAKP